MMRFDKANRACVSGQLDLYDMKSGKRVHHAVVFSHRAVQLGWSRSKIGLRGAWCSPGSILLGLLTGKCCGIVIPLRLITDRGIA